VLTLPRKIDYKRGMALKAVTLAEIERIFEVLARLDISREAVIIPLRPGHPGGVRRLPNGKLEILVEGETALDEWLPELERQLAAVTAQPA
jgi:hypothetical protein